MTRVLAWVRAFTSGRRRIAALTSRPAMVLARWATAPAVTALHVDYRRTVLGRGDATVAPVVRSAEPVVRRGAFRAIPGGRGAQGPRGSAGAAGPRGRAGTALVLARERPGGQPPAFAGSMPPPAVAAAVRRSAGQLADAHRRVESQAPPRLRALPIETRAPEVARSGAAPRLRAVPSSAAHDQTPAMVLRRSPAAIAEAAAQAALDASAAAPGRELVSARHAAAGPALDIESLTDRVVGQIDRRIVAHRERFGQL